ncbi:putative pre-mRNA-splicing factor ATP-dependent RNA helicase DHX32 isoform X2 [Esox lucius]|uniref:putative pre-mRNA-splicing factor ATP-dependent RNA helicase DHX32 isoform X2 n=1 Tax=Esox lucius TaxID=8010 RepID=UPI00097335AF|nr:putative pre-mRNA-splicing factor ATP-dependent RNA helicase DHX32 isoform X2 [Esox lucius]
MSQVITGDKYWEDRVAFETEGARHEHINDDDVLQLNQFDGLPYSSRFYTLLKERMDLPVWKAKCDFMDKLANRQFVIVSGTAKTGRSSQIPQWCTEFCLSVQYQNGMVVCSQVHRQHTVDLALRVADEMDVNIGHEVGYSIPLETCCSGDTVLRYCTDDMLLREMMSDPMLEHYGVVIIDQAHERTVSTDVLLGLLKEIALQRPELRVVLLTATHPGPKLLNHYRTAPLIQLEEVCSAEVVYTGTSHKDYFCSALRLVLEIHHSQEEGDIVVFLATNQEIDLARDILCREEADIPPHLGELLPISVYPGLAGSLPMTGEEEGRCRRVFLTSSPNEDLFWSVHTLNFVIDGGVQKRSVYNPRIRANSVAIQPISRSQAESRKQLVRPTGKTFCLYPEDTPLPSETRPHILESDITSTVLFLKRMDIGGLSHCDFMDRPDPECLMQALEDLDYLAALDDDGNLSEIGIIMSEFPLEPQMAKTLLASSPNCFLIPRMEMRLEASQRHLKFQHPEGDHFTLINIYKAFKQNQQEPFVSVEKWCQDYFLSLSALQTADAIRSELTDILRRIELPVSMPSFGSKGNTLNIKRALLAGFFMQVARDVDSSGNYFILTHKHVAQIHPLSAYGTKTPKLGLPEWILFHEYTFSEDNCIRTLTHISPEEFIQMAPQYFFYNLPPSESKDILQNMLDKGAEHYKAKKIKKSPSIESIPEVTASCIIQ